MKARPVPYRQSGSREARSTKPLFRSTGTTDQVASAQDATSVHDPLPTDACVKVASDLWLDGGFAPGTLVSSTTYNWLVTQYGSKGDDKRNSQRIPNIGTCLHMHRVNRFTRPLLNLYSTNVPCFNGRGYEKVFSPEPQCPPTLKNALHTDCLLCLASRQ